MFRAAVCPCRSATTQCSSRIDLPDRASGLLGERQCGPNTDAHHHELGEKTGAIVEHHGLLLDAVDRAPEVEPHAVLLVECAHEVSDLRPHHALERALVRSHHADLERARAQ
jgi:hypothetical protein